MENVNSNGRKVVVYGVDKQLGFSRLFVDAIAADGGLMDTYRYESQSLSIDELWQKYGKKAVRYLRKTYAITASEIPTQLRRV